MSMLPRLDCTDPVAARSEMNRFVRLSTLLGLHSLTDPEVDVVNRICPCDGTFTVTFHGFDAVATSEVSRCARREHYKVLCHALQPRQSGSTGYNSAANHGKSQVVNGR
jgi:hypothetical protein